MRRGRREILTRKTSNTHGRIKRMEKRDSEKRGQREIFGGRKISAGGNDGGGGRGAVRSR